MSISLVLARRLPWATTVRLVFDRGTIVLRDVPSDVDLSDLPGVLWDPRVRALRAPARYYATIRRDLEHRSVRFADEVYRGADELPPDAAVLRYRRRVDAAHVLEIVQSR